MRSKSGSGIGRGLQQISQPTLPTARQIMQKSAPQWGVRVPATKVGQRTRNYGSNSEAKTLAAPAIFSQHALDTDRSEQQIAPLTSRIEHRAAHKQKRLFDSAKTKVGQRSTTYLKATSSFMQKLERNDSQQSLNSNYLAKISSRHNGSTAKKQPSAMRCSFSRQASVRDGVPQSATKHCKTSAQKTRPKSNVYAQTSSSAAKKADGGAKRFSVMPRSFVAKVAQQKAIADKKQEHKDRQELYF